MKIKTVIDALELFAPLSWQESFDNAGLITGNKEWELTGALLCLDSVEAVVDEAIAKKCNLIVAHHPIVFSGLKKISNNTYVERTLIKAIKNDIAIYAIHTNLDNVYEGVNRKIAEKIGLANTSVLLPKSGTLKKLVTFCPTAQAETVRMALCNAGAGTIGNYDQCSFYTEGIGTFKAGEASNPFAGTIGELHKENETRIEVIFPSTMQKSLLMALRSAHPYEEVAYDIYTLENTNPMVGAGLIGELEQPLEAGEFLKYLKKTLNLSCIRHTSLNFQTVKRVAVCGGAGSFLLTDAIRAKAQFFITADFKYHQFFDADNKIVIADIGHYESEIYTVELMAQLIQKKIPTFVPVFSETNTNPVNYYC
jgi:dinuclear metal center YbgI/SA1388 family protein